MGSLLAILRWIPSLLVPGAAALGIKGYVDDFNGVDTVLFKTFGIPVTAQGLAFILLLLGSIWVIGLLSYRVHRLEGDRKRPRN